MNFRRNGLFLGLLLFVRLQSLGQSCNGVSQDGVWIYDTEYERLQSRTVVSIRRVENPVTVPTAQFQFGGPSKRCEQLETVIVSKNGEAALLYFQNETTVVLLNSVTLGSGGAGLDSDEGFPRFSPQGRFALQAWEGEFQVFSLGQHFDIIIRESIPKDFVSLSISDNDTRLYVRTKSNTVTWDLTLKPPRIVAGHPLADLPDADFVRQHVLTDDRRFLIGSGQGMAKIWDIEEGKVLNTFNTNLSLSAFHGSYRQAVLLSNDGRRGAILGVPPDNTDWEVFIWIVDVPTGIVLVKFTIPSFIGYFGGVAFSENGDHLYLYEDGEQRPLRIPDLTPVTQIVYDPKTKQVLLDWLPRELPPKEVLIRYANDVNQVEWNEVSITHRPFQIPPLTGGHRFYRVARVAQAP